jgi:hypothetical protein
MGIITARPCLSLHQAGVEIIVAFSLRISQHAYHYEQMNKWPFVAACSIQFIDCLEHAVMRCCCFLGSLDTAAATLTAYLDSKQSCSIAWFIVSPATVKLILPRQTEETYKGVRTIPSITSIAV